MIEFVSKDGYSVYVENEGDDMWVSVRHGEEHLYDCIVGTVDDGAHKKERIQTAYMQYYPANYVSENMNANDDRQRVYELMEEACAIDHALEMAMYI